jgi:hypothetical protein
MIVGAVLQAGKTARVGEAGIDLLRVQAESRGL